MLNVLYYTRPRCLAEALELAASDELTPIAGGTDVIPELRHGVPKRLLDTKGLGLDYVKVDGGMVEVGACVTHSRLADDASVKSELPLLSRAAGLVGTRQIRNRGTIGGNIANASPCADTVPALLSYEAEVLLVSRSGERRVPLEQFILAPYSTVRKPDELLRSIVCKRSRPGARLSFVKLGRRGAVNISRMTLAVHAEMGPDGVVSEIRLSAGSVLPVPSRLKDIENLLRGKPATRESFKEAGAAAAEFMIGASGVRWSTPYKGPVLTGLVERALSEALLEE
jgi:CO/xanthine dehydrogenase FAD-binding subunit